MKTVKRITLILVLMMAFSPYSQDTLPDDRTHLEIISEQLDISEREAYDTLVAEQRVQAFRNLAIFATMFLSMLSIKRVFKHSTSITSPADYKTTESYVAYFKAYTTHNEAYTSYANAKAQEIAKTTPDRSPGYTSTIDRFPDYVAPEPTIIAAEIPNNVRAVIILVLSLSIFIGSLIYNSVMLSETFTGLFNPEYGALEQLEFLKK